MSRLRCNRPDCDEPIIWAFRPRGGPRLPYEAADRVPFSDNAMGAHVVVAGKAWIPGDLIEHFRVRFEISVEQASDLVGEYPWHRPHVHERADDDEREVTFP